MARSSVGAATIRLTLALETTASCAAWVSVMVPAEEDAGRPAKAS